MQKYLKYSLVIVVLLLTTVMSSWSAYKAPEAIKVVMDNNYPPYVFYDDKGELQGILVDEWALFEEKTGIDVTIDAMDWGDALEAMAAGEYDVIDTIFETEERQKLYDFTEAYAEIDVSIFFHKNISGINTIESVKGFAVAAKRGDQAVNELKAAGVENITLYESYEAIIQAAERGEVVTFVIDNPPARYFLFKYGIQDAFKYTEPLYTGYFHRAVQKGNTPLVDILEEGFNQITGTERQAIQDKWFGKSAGLAKALSRYILYFFGGGVIILVGLLVWNRTLSRSVNSKTEELSQAIERLTYNKSKLNAVIESLPDWVFVVRKDGLFIDFLTPKHTDRLLTTPENFLGHHVEEFFGSKLTMQINSSIIEAIETNITQTLEYQLDTDGMQYYEARFSALNASEVIVVIRDITERMLSQQEIMKLSIMDTPTGVYNRNYFEEQLEIMRNQSLEGISFLMVDFDGLKLVNDTLGHGVGDQYLETVAELLKEYFKDADFIARIGGDEFVVVMRNQAEEEVLGLKRALLEKIKSLNVDNQLIPFSISIGFCTYSPETPTIEEMIKFADDFMYREKLFHRQSTKSKNIETLITMLDERDFITQGHAHRMAELVMKLAEKLEVNESLMDDLALFAQFHDIGKIGISDTILFKEGRLDEKEYTEMKRHTEIGYRIAESSSDLMHISEWIYKHHEWWNGKGYPFGLKGEEIPLACRLLTIVDAYDAMTNDRPYRQAMAKEDAIAELQTYSGKQFDPNIVSVFIDLIESEE